MGSHRGSQDDPAPGDKKSRGQKRTITSSKNEIKTFSRGRNKTERDSNGTPTIQTVIVGGVSVSYF